MNLTIMVQIVLMRLNICLQVIRFYLCDDDKFKKDFLCLPRNAQAMRDMKEL